MQFTLTENGIKLLFYGLILLAVVLETIGDILFKQWAISNKLSFIYIGLLIYFFGSIFWALSLKYELLSKAIIVFTILNLIAVVAAGVLFFKEQLTPAHIAGIILGID